MSQQAWRDTAPCKLDLCSPHSVNLQENKNREKREKLIFPYESVERKWLATPPPPPPNQPLLFQCTNCHCVDGVCISIKVAVVQSTSIARCKHDYVSIPTPPLGDGQLYGFLHTWDGHGMGGGGGEDEEEEGRREGGREGRRVGGRGEERVLKREG